MFILFIIINQLFLNNTFFFFFLFRNLFTRKQSARLEKQNDVRWKLFGKVPPGENLQKDPKKIQKVFFKFCVRINGE